MQIYWEDGKERDRLGGLGVDGKIYQNKACTNTYSLVEWI
jgi:hypothetical protein